MELHPRLAAMAEALEETGWAAELCDPDWRVVWMSGQLRRLLGGVDDEQLGIGVHVIESRLARALERFVSLESQLSWAKANVPHMLDGTEECRERLAQMFSEPEVQKLVRTLEPVEFPAWTEVLNWRPLGRIRYFGLRPRGRDGEEFGTIYLYGSNLPASLLALVARGDTGMFERMARLVDSGRREAAVMFADLQASAALSRRLPTAQYFRLLQSLTTAIDSMVIRHRGIVGKHAGDGVTAFFLRDDLGSPSATARAAVEAARGACAVAREAAYELGKPIALNVGLHWGGTLYMGQMVTDGRLEVTALGDEVNECARIQETARDGALLASKPLVERLDPDDAAALGIDPDALEYRALGELPGVTDKALRDAGGLAVCDLGAG